MRLSLLQLDYLLVTAHLYVILNLIQIIPVVPGRRAMQYGQHLLSRYRYFHISIMMYILQWCMFSDRSTSIPPSISNSSSPHIISPYMYPFVSLSACLSNSSSRCVLCPTTLSSWLRRLFRSVCCYEDSHQ